MRWPVLPASEVFKRNLQDFQRRLSNTKVVDAFANNVLSDNKKVKLSQNKLDLGQNHKLMLGVKREEQDLDGRKFLRVPATNLAIFKEPMSNDGAV